MSYFTKKYIVFGLVSFATSLLGSHCVYYYYQPMSDFEDLVNAEFEELKKSYSVDCVPPETVTENTK